MEKSIIKFRNQNTSLKIHNGIEKNFIQKVLNIINVESFSKKISGQINGINFYLKPDFILKNKIEENLIFDD